MFKLSEECMKDRSILKYDYIRQTPQSILSANRPNEQNYIDMPNKNSVKYSKDSYLE